jgi:hypothetical protein
MWETQVMSFAIYSHIYCIAYRHQAGLAAGGQHWERLGGNEAVGSV